MLDNNVPHIRRTRQTRESFGTTAHPKCSCEPQPNFNTAHDLRVTHCPERATPQTTSIPFCRHRIIDACTQTNVDTKTCVQTIADQDATLQSSGMVGHSKGAAHLPLVNPEKVTNKRAKVLTREAFRPPDHKSSAHWHSGPPQQGSPLDMASSSHKKQLLPHCRRSMTTACCSSPVSEP